MQGGRAFLRLHTRFQITEKELPYIVNHYLHCYNDCLPDPLRLFSATETAFSSANTTRLKTLAEKGNKRAALVCKLLERYDRLLSTILIGNNIVNIATASIGTVLFVRHYGDAGATISTVVVTVVVLISVRSLRRALQRTAQSSGPCCPRRCFRSLFGFLRR